MAYNYFVPAVNYAEEFAETYDSEQFREDDQLCAVLVKMIIFIQEFENAEETR